MIRARLRAAFIGFSRPWLIARGLHADETDQRINEILREISHLKLDLEATGHLGRSGARQLMATAMDAAIAIVKRDTPREPDDPWWDGYDGGIADAKRDLTLLKADLLSRYDEALQ